MTAFLKLTPELLNAVGANTGEEFCTCLISKLTTIEAAVTSHSKALAAIAAQPKLDEAAVKAIAKSAGSQAAVSALANTGSAMPAAACPAGNADGGKSSTADALIAAGKYEEAYAADPKLKEDFFDAGSYAAYMRHEGKGRLSTRVVAAAANPKT